MTSKNKRPLQGATDEGEGAVAVIKTGLRVDKPRPGSMVQRKGIVLGVKRAADEIMRLRTNQVGKRAASASLGKCEGRWLGGKGEPTLVCEIEHIPSPREMGAAIFRSHMISLGEEMAGRFGQHEVWVKVGKRLYRTNAPGESGPKPLRRGGKVIR